MLTDFSRLTVHCKSEPEEACSEENFYYVYPIYIYLYNYYSYIYFIVLCGQMKGFISSITTIMCEVGSYRMLE